MSRAGAFALAGLIACLAGCSPPEPGKPVSIADLCNQPDDSRVRLDGWLRYRRGLLSFCSETNGKTTSCDLALYAEETRPPDFNVMAPPTSGPEPVQARLTVKVGSGPGRMEDLPERFDASDVKLHLEGGKVATDGDRVIIDGKLAVIPSMPGEENEPKTCFVYVDRAEAAD